MLKIINNTAKVTTFDDLKQGDVFKYKEYIGMKTENLYDKENCETINAINLIDGDMLVMYGTEIVTPVDAVMTINEFKN